MIRQLGYLVALARAQHFGRAAAACNVTQPTLSAGIKQLEEALGGPMVKRGRRYQGLTADGERVLAWAQRILADWESLNQEVAQAHGSLGGRLRIGAIPAALPTIALLTTPFVRAHPLASVTVLAQSSVEIQRGLDDYTIDVGVSYLDNEILASVVTLPLYTERYVLLTPAEGPYARRRSVTWREAAGLPLCLLTEDMQHRRILDGLFRQAGARPKVAVETNAVTGLLSQVRLGGLSSVMPHSFLSLFASLEGSAIVPLVEPAAAHVIGLIAADRQPQPPLTLAAFAVARRAGIARRLDQVWKRFTR